MSMTSPVFLIFEASAFERYVDSAFEASAFEMLDSVLGYCEPQQLRSIKN